MNVCSGDDCMVHLDDAGYGFVRADGRRRAFLGVDFLAAETQEEMAI